MIQSLVAVHNHVQDGQANASSTKVRWKSLEGSTRCYRYLARQCREVEAVSGWRLGKQRGRGGLGEPRPTILPPEAMHHSKGKRRPEFHFQVSGLGRQVPVQVFRCRCRFRARTRTRT